MSSFEVCDEIGRWVEYRRLAIGLTLSELEALTGVSRSSLVRMQNGNQGMSIGNVIAVIQALGGDIEVKEASYAISPGAQIGEE
jgi:transcriptional regulator with XRE-family HTH domain